ncbi:hypothetical protein [Nocardioides taihuensis]|uniref:Fibronectin type-III domain-containing protein n=1 Tax=Nocardioides taihuensis TaxID=1835606 RepID=A0ABW0BRD0_9ACTN
MTTTSPATPRRPRRAVAALVAAGSLLVAALATLPGGGPALADGRGDEGVVRRPGTPAMKWGPVSPVSPGGETVGGAPAVSDDMRGDVAVVWLGWDGASWRVRYSEHHPRSPWTDPVWVSPAGQDAVDPQVFSQRALARGGGPVRLVTWLSEEGGHAVVRASVRGDERRWSRPTTVSDPAKDAADATPMVLGGAPVVFYRSRGASWRLEQAVLDLQAVVTERLHLSPAGAEVHDFAVTGRGRNDNFRLAFSEWDGTYFRARWYDVQWWRALVAQDQPHTVTGYDEDMFTPVVRGGALTWTNVVDGVTRLRGDAGWAGEPGPAPPETLSAPGSDVTDVRGDDPATRVWLESSGGVHRLVMSVASGGGWGPARYLSPAGVDATAAVVRLTSKAWGVRQVTWAEQRADGSEGWSVVTMPTSGYGDTALPTQRLDISGQPLAITASAPSLRRPSWAVVWQGDDGGVHAVGLDPWLPSAVVGVHPRLARRQAPRQVAVTLRPRDSWVPARSYQLREWVSPDYAPTEDHVTRTVEVGSRDTVRLSLVRDSFRPGHRYCYQARETDATGVTGRWEGGSWQCLELPYDDRAFDASPGWHRITGPRFYGGSALVTTDRGATLSFDRQQGYFGRIEFLAARGPGAGAIKVTGAESYPGDATKPVSLAQSKRRPASLVRWFYSHNLFFTDEPVRVRVVTSGRRVVIDGIVFAQLPKPCWIGEQEGWGDSCWPD